MGVISLKVDFHSRVKKIEAMYERSRVKSNLNLAQLLRLRVAFHTCVYFIYAWKFYVR